MKPASVDGYLNALEKMKRSPRDRVGILGEFSLTGIGAAAGFAASGSVATIAGAATLAGSTTLASILGGIFVTATPVGWVVGSTLVGASFAFAAAKLARSGGKMDAYRINSIRDLENRIAEIQRAAKNADDHNAKFREVITGIQFLVASSRMTPEKSAELLLAVQNSQIDIDTAFDLIQAIVGEDIPVNEVHV